MMYYNVCIQYKQATMALEYTIGEATIRIFSWFIFSLRLKFLAVLTIVKYLEETEWGLLLKKEKETDC